MEKEAQAALMLHFCEAFSLSDIIKLYRQAGSFFGILQQDTLPEHLSPKLKRSLERLEEEQQTLADQAETVLHWCRLHGVQPLCLSHPSYPALLSEISTPPALLFARGDVTQLGLPQVAIVGSRHATISGLNTAFDFAKTLAGSGFVVTSGLALGIDGSAHNGALAAGTTIAVMGTGLDVMYPKQHRMLHQKILDQGGAVVSEFMPGTPPIPSNFPRRNRIISGLSLGTMVVEAAIKSGSLITAKYAMEQGREVFAIPGSIHNVLSKGAHALLKQGASLVESAADIVDQLGGILSYLEPEKTDLKVPESTHSKLLEAMGFDPVDMDTLVRRTGFTVAELSRDLVELELEGVIVNNNGFYDRLK
jgi:DNA processing protein